MALSALVTSMSQVSAVPAPVVVAACALPHPHMDLLHIASRRDPDVVAMLDRDQAFED